MSDDIDVILNQWATERPDLDSGSMAVFGRLSRIYAHVQDRYRENARAYHLGPGEFDVLATLRRSGAPFTLTAGDLTRSLMVTGGAITNRIDRLVTKKLVDRHEDPSDRRSVLISLTETGRMLIDEIVVDHVDRQDAMLQGLTKDEQRQLSDLLRKLLHQFEP